MKKTVALLLLVFALTLGLSACDLSGTVTDGIIVSVMPEKTVYEEGDIFDPSGMQVALKYTDGSSEIISDYQIAPKDALTINDLKVTVMYIKDGKTYTADVAVTVKGKESATLAAPTVSVRGSFAVWDAVQGAESYEVYVDGQLAGTVTGTRFALTFDSGAHDVYVVAKGTNEGESVKSKPSGIVTYVAEGDVPGVPVISLFDNEVKWKPVKNAAVYEIYVNDEKAGETTLTECTLPYTLTGVYSVKVRAKAADGIATGDFSNVCDYIIEMDITVPLVLVTYDNRVASFGGNGFLTAEQTYAEGRSYENAALMLEKADDWYYIKSKDGQYLVYADGKGVLEDRTYVFADKLDKNDDAFKWQIERVQGSADRYRVSNMAVKTQSYLSCADGDIRVDRVSSAILPEEAYEFRFCKAEVDESSFAQGQEAVVSPFDITKPFVMNYVSLSDRNYYMGIVSEASCPVQDFLSEKTGFIKYAPAELTGKSVFMFEEAVGYDENSVYNPENARLYRIRTYDGRYLAIAKGNYFFYSGAGDYVAAVEYSESDFSQIWSIIVKEDGVVRIQNMSYNFDWDIQNAYGSLCAYLTNLNAGDGHAGMSIYNADYADYYDIKLTNVDVEMKPVYRSDLSGKTAKITYLGREDRYMTLGSENIMQVKDMSSAESFTFEKAEINGLNGAYRIRIGNGDYLTYTDWKTIEALPENGDDSQIFILTSVCGFSSAYLISPYCAGKTPDPIDNTQKYNYLFVNDEGTNHPQLSGDDIMRVYGEVGRVEHRNYFERIWLLDFID